MKRKGRTIGGGGGGGKKQKRQKKKNNLCRGVGGTIVMFIEPPIANENKVLRASAMGRASRLAQ
jgi:hypothetical protein